MNIDKLKESLIKHEQPGFRLKQIQKAVYQDGASSFLQISSLPKDLREKLNKETKILSFGVIKIIKSRDDQSVKALLNLKDGQIIETVLISPKPDFWSVCLSSQAGCSLNCRFCATGKRGFQRNLTSEEITDQVLFWRQYLKKNSKIENWKMGIRNYDISNIVYMGMGEPFLNWDNVYRSLKTLTDKNLFSFGARSISVSTSGIPEGIEKLAEKFLQVNLAVSLHFADNKKRSEFMPVNRKYDLDSLKKSLQEYFRKTNRKVFVEYILLSGINDSWKEAEKLAKYLKSIGKPQLLHVNLIRYNPPSVIPSEVEESNLKSLDPSTALHCAQDGILLRPSSKIQTQKFKEYLLQNRINATIRKSLGEEIQGACGQLAGK